jgi:hypothetical protein
MSSKGSKPSWMGGCVLRIRRAVAAFIEAAERNLIVGERPDCEARKPDVPRTLMAKDFRRKATEVEIEFFLASEAPEGLFQRPEYPADERLPEDVRRELEALGIVLRGQLNTWGWLSKDSDSTTEKLVYEIGESDLWRMKSHLRSLDKAIAIHIPPPKPPMEDEDGNWPWKPGFHLADLDDSEPLRFVRLMGGKQGYFRPGNTKRWVLSAQWHEVSVSTLARAMCLTNAGRWIGARSYVGVGSSLKSFDRRSQCIFEEYNAHEAMDWFLYRWLDPNEGEGDSLPAEILAAVGQLDLDYGPDGGRNSSDRLRESSEVSTVTTSKPPEREAEVPRDGETADLPADSPDMVTLDQAAAAVHSNKRTLERMKDREGFPAPAVKGKPGRAYLYDWSRLRPWLESEFNIRLPEKFPARRPH